MTFQSTYWIPHSERYLFEKFDADDSMVCVGEDTMGRMYKSKPIYICLAPDAGKELNGKNSDPVDADTDGD